MDFPVIDRNTAQIEYYKALEIHDRNHKLLSGLTDLLNFKTDLGISDEKFNDKFNEVFQQAISNFDNSKEDYLKAKIRYNEAFEK
jgi:hypothetical protein